MTLFATLLLALLMAAPPSYAQEHEAGSSRAQQQANSRADHSERSATLYGGTDSLLVVIEGPADSALTLRQCIDESMRANDQLQVEHERLNELHAKKVQARADGLPSLDLVGNYSRGRDPSFALDSTFGGGGNGGGFGPVSTGNAAFDSLFTEAMGQLFAGDNGGFIPAPENIPAQTFWRASADLSWELHPTRVIYALKAANIAIEQQELVIQDTENRTIEDTMQRYYSVLSAQAQVRSLQAELDARHEFLDISRRRYFLGLTTGLDTLQARVRLMNLVPQLRRAQQDVEDAGAQLNIQMGRDAHTPLQILEEFQIESDPVDLDQAVALALKRPDITKSELSEDYLHHERDTLKSEMHPYLRLNAAYGYVTRDLSEFTNRGHDFWSTGVSLTVPLFDGFLTKGRVHERDAAIRRTQHQTSGLRKDAEAEVISALGELKIARANLSAAKLNREQAEEALTQMNRRYELGKAGYLDVLNAQAARFTARSNLIQAYHDVLAWTATLKRAMGVRPTRPLSEIEEIQP